MLKKDVFKKKKWLKDRQRANKIKKQIDYLTKTCKGIDKSMLQEISKRAQKNQKPEKTKKRNNFKKR